MLPKEKRFSDIALANILPRLATIHGMIMQSRVRFRSSDRQSKDIRRTTQKSSSTGNELMANTDDFNTEEQSPVPDYRNDHSRPLIQLMRLRLGQQWYMVKWSEHRWGWASSEKTRLKLKEEASKMKKGYRGCGEQRLKRLESQVAGEEYDIPVLTEEDMQGNCGKKNRLYTWVKNCLRSPQFPNSSMLSEYM
ncbi:unnamed protein product [Mytilus edulis]|uniref:Uncharacterized protein n=1 Tax=Mytilus edulis TaxID=6550 RepID=A0A8S3TXQ3_MYTED|nr:unnamed protein product [Mytilus edulis]